MNLSMETKLRSDVTLPTGGAGQNNNRWSTWSVQHNSALMHQQIGIKTTSIQKCRRHSRCADVILDALTSFLIHLFIWILTCIQTYIHTCITIVMYTRILARITTCIPMRIENDVSVFGLMFRFRFAVASMSNRVERMTFRINDCW